MQDLRGFTVTFSNKQAASGDSFADTLDRFAAADRRWAPLLELAAADLSDTARRCFGFALRLIEPGPAPRLLMFDLKPDDAKTIREEARHMTLEQLTAIGVTLPAIVGPGHADIAKVEGLVTAVHRLLRTAKARP